MATTAPGASGPPVVVADASALVIGNLTAAQLERVRDAIVAALAPEHVQSVSLPSASTSSSMASPGPAFLPDHDPSQPALLTLAAAGAMDGLCRRLHQAARNEHKLNKAMAAIHEYQKQQQRVIADFGLLSQKYTQAKATLQAVLWQRMPRLEEFRTIPALDAALEEADARVGPYALGALLGSGHFANVREIQERQEEGRPLVLKAIDKGHVKNLQSLLRVAHEIEALRRLRHPNIIRLYDVLHGKRCVYLVTERLSTDLYEIIGEHPEGASGDLAQRIITPILSAVLHIHANGFLHRDLKPENILVSRPADPATGELVVKLCDFGLCCHVPPPGTLLTDFVGSPGFLCPEMLVEKKYNGKLADFFSVGCVLLELLLPAADFAQVWMATFSDEAMADGLQFRHRLRGACAGAGAILRGKLAGSHDDLLGLTTGLIKVDAFQRYSTTEAQRFLNAVGFRPPAAETAAEAEAEAACTVGLERLALADDAAGDGMATAALRANTEAKKQLGRRSPVPLVASITTTASSSSSRRAISPIPSPSREMALAPSATTSAATDDDDGDAGIEQGEDSGAAPAPKRLGDNGAPARPAGLIISSPKAVGKAHQQHGGGVRATLRAQALLGSDLAAPGQRLREKDIPLRPDSPGTPLGLSPAPSLLDDSLNSPQAAGTPLGSPTAAATAAGGVVEG